MVGNPATDEKFDGNALVPFAHGMDLISDEIFEVKIKYLESLILNVIRKSVGFFLIKISFI